MPNVNMFAPVGVTVAPSASRGTLYTVGANGVVSVDANDVPDLLSRGFEFTPQIGQAPVSRNPYILAQTAVAVVLPSSGSSNASGQITLTTALPYAPNGTVGVYLPTGVVTAGSQGSGAGIYQATFSSTTVCQLTGTGIVTANGAYTQTTGADIALATVIVPGGAMGPNGALRIFNSFQWPNNVNNKIVKVAVNTIVGNVGQFNTRTTTAGGWGIFSIRNRGAQNVQMCSPANNNEPFLGQSFATAFDFSTAQPVIFGAQLAVATDFVMLEGYGVEVLPSP